MFTPLFINVIALQVHIILSRDQVLGLMMRKINIAQIRLLILDIVKKKTSQLLKLEEKNLVMTQIIIQEGQVEEEDYHLDQEFL